MHTIGHKSFFHLKKANLWLVLITADNVNAAMGFSLLYGYVRASGGFNHRANMLAAFDCVCTFQCRRGCVDREDVKYDYMAITCGRVCMQLAHQLV